MFPYLFGTVTQRVTNRCRSFVPPGTQNTLIQQRISLFDQCAALVAFVAHSKYNTIQPVFYYFSITYMFLTRDDLELYTYWHVLRMLRLVLHFS